jgi:hypothetical protein
MNLANALTEYELLLQLIIGKNASDDMLIGFQNTRFLDALKQYQGQLAQLKSAADSKITEIRENLQ